MKVYVVLNRNDADGQYIYGIFSSLTTAERFVVDEGKKSTDYLEIEEFEVEQ